MDLESHSPARAEVQVPADSAEGAAGNLQNSGRLMFIHSAPAAETGHLREVLHCPAEDAD